MWGDVLLYGSVFIVFPAFVLGIAKIVQIHHRHLARRKRT